MKKSATLFLFLLALLPFVASAHDVEVNGIYYNLDKKANTATVTYYGDKNSSAKYTGEVKIPESIKSNGTEYAVTAIGSYAFNNCTELTYIAIPSSVLTIGKQAFKDCTGLKGVLASNYVKIKFEDAYSRPDRYTNGVVIVIKKDEDDDDGKELVFFIDTPFMVEKRPQSTGIQAADRYVASLLFGEECDNLGQAYDKFKALWKKQGLDEQTKDTWRKISFSVDEEYVSSNKRFACYHVKASLTGSIQLSNVPQTPQGQKMKNQYFTLANGVNHYFIVDLIRGQLVGIDEAFQPTVAAKLKEMFGDKINLYAEDRCLQLLSSKGDGRFIFSQVSEKNFTDYFKQLVGWNELGDIPTPEFLHGRQGLDDYFGKSLSLAPEKYEADTVVVSLIVREDGSVIQPTIEKGVSFAPSNLLELCSKMPKWKPAYEGGIPVAREASFTLRIGRKVFGVVEQMPSYPGGMGALMQYLSSNIKYPEECEEKGIQGRVICTFVVELNGDITDVSAVKPVHPALDAEAIRVISAMPRWQPARQKGKLVRAKYTLPITFRLQ